MKIFKCIKNLINNYKVMEKDEMLIEICNKLWYKMDKDIYLNEYWYLVEEHSCWVADYINVTEIIFTQEFIDKLIEYLEKKKCKKKFIQDFLLSILFRLDNIVDYIYNLINE
jgi:hypothetical protein